MSLLPMTGDRLFYLESAVLCAGLAAWFGWLLTPLVRSLALRLGAMQAPRARDVHVDPVPRLGGLAIYLAFVAALVVGALLVEVAFHRAIAPRALHAGVGLLIAGTLLTALGVVDDLKDLSPGKQLILQIVFA